MLQHFFPFLNEFFQSFVNANIEQLQLITNDLFIRHSQAVKSLS